MFLLETFDYVTGDLYDVEAVNLYSDQIDTNVFDTNAIVLPVDLDAVVANGGPDLTGADTPITYWAAHAQRLHRCRSGQHGRSRLQHRLAEPAGGQW